MAINERTKYLAEKVLLSQLYNTIDLNSDKFALDVLNTQLRDHFIRTEKRREPILYSGVFLARGSVPICPFSLSFRLADGEMGARLANLTIAPFDCGIGPRLHAYLSILDYLSTTEQLSVSFKEQLDYLVHHSGEHRKRFAADYPAFKDRCIKRLPYDLSIEVLETLCAVA
ncbi:hypothetical protein V4C53_30110 [Paraburkholderia azotifigens]|uniref:hypothetical protein n=1 Tax=Paraburkholderia azotifigens TaxID=2057004 RepID=UPI003181DBBE